MNERIGDYTPELKINVEANMWIERLQNLILKAISVDKRIESVTLDTTVDELWSILDDGLEVFETIAELGQHRASGFDIFAESIKSRKVMPELCTVVMSIKLKGTIESYREMIKRENLTDLLPQPTVN